VELLVCSIKDKMNVKNCGDRTGFLCIKWQWSGGKELEVLAQREQ
jgi:hypothetical protein